MSITGSYILLLFFFALLIGAGYLLIEHDKNSKLEIRQSAVVESVTVGAPGVTTSADRELVCRATAAALFGRPIYIMASTTNKSGIVIVEYDRPSDGSHWAVACRIESDQVYWASVEDGVIRRWRDPSLEERISFRLKENNVLILQSYPDGSQSMNEFPRSGN